MAGTITVGELLSDPTSSNKITIGSGTTLDLAGSAGSVTGAGKVLQVVSTVFAAASTTATAATEIFSASITPSSTSSKILVLSAIHIYRSAAGHNHITLYRDASSLLAIQTKDGYGPHHTMLPVNHLDSPSTTSAVAYKIYAHKRSGESGTLNFGDGGTNNTVTLMEIAG
jgi:hypothetical protein